MKVEISIGEGVDKLNILDIKCKRINDPNKVDYVKKEIKELEKDFGCYRKSDYYKILTYINETIWDLQNEEFSTENAKKIFDFNKKRFRIKKIFDIESNIKEQKGYNEKSCVLLFNSYEILFHKIPEINFLLIEYDNVYTFTSATQKMFPFIKKIDKYDTNNECVILENYEVPKEIDRNVFELEPIKYISSGMLGDYILQLSIINEKFYETGRKGILYMTDAREFFRNGVKKTFEDTYEIISKQNYIHSTKIYEDEEYDIDLSCWRTRPDIFETRSWNKTFKEFYDVDWARMKWLDNIPFDPKWKDKTVVNTTRSRPYSKIPNGVIDEENYVFVTNSDEDYEQFCLISGTRLNVYKPTSFTDVCTVINSCKQFLGSLSAFLAIAHAMHKPRMTLLSGIFVDDIKVLEN